MNLAKFTNLLSHIQQEELKVREEGQKEYAHTDANCFANFERIGIQIGFPREKVLLVYALKHWDGIVAHINGHKSQREDIRGRIKDLRMYMALLWGMIEEEIGQEEEYE
jgi:hypothetical protein